MNSVIHIARYSSPLGRVNVASSDAGLLSLDFNSSVKGFSASLIDRFGPGIRQVDSTERFTELFRLFDAYFSGKATSFKSLALDIKGSPFEFRLWTKLRSVPFAETLSYAELAKMACSPYGARAAGSACGRNPVPLIIPCHRVISSSGALGGYSAGGGGTRRGLKGIELKRALLDLEGARAYPVFSDAR